MTNNSSSESILAEVIAASIGGSIAASVLYPLEVLKTKLQAESKQPQKPQQDGEEEPESSSASSEDLLLDVVVSSSGQSDDSEEEDDDDIHPITTTVAPPQSSIKYAINLYQQDGIAPFYAGIGTSAFQSATEKALYFFAYTGLKNVYSALSSSNNNHKNAQIGPVVNLIIGSLAEWAHLPITLPIDCWTTKIQTSNSKNETPFAILMTMLGEPSGIRGMYKGIQAYTVLCLKPAIQYTVFEQVKGVVLAKRRLRKGGGGGKEMLSAMEAFFLGMVARTIATVVVFPYLRAKVMLQSQAAVQSTTDDEARATKANIPAMIAQMYNDGGMAEIFQGIGPELTRGVLSAALMMMVKEKISVVVNEALRAG